MLGLLINIDVPDLSTAIAFYTSALGFTVSRRLGPDMVELAGGSSLVYLLQKPAGPGAVPDAETPRDYARHWTPVHLDVIVTNLDAAVARVQAAGARLELPIVDDTWGRMAVFADPFGHGFCLVQFSERGYDALVDDG